MKGLAGTLKLELAQYREVADFVKFGSELDEATTSLINKGVRLTEVLKQDKYSPMDVLSQVLTIGLAVFDYYEHIAVENIATYQKTLFNMFSLIDLFYPFFEFIVCINPISFFKIMNFYTISIIEGQYEKYCAVHKRTNLSLYFTTK